MENICDYLKKNHIVTFVATVLFVLFIFIGMKVLPMLPDGITNNVDRIFAVIAFVGLATWINSVKRRSQTTCS